MSNGVSDKSRGVTLGLGALLGVLGVHRFYVGKIGTGVLMFLTGGGAAIWWIIDLVSIATGEFKDADGRRVLRWAVETDYERLAEPELNDEIDAINEDLDDMTARLERAERQLELRSHSDRD